MKTKIKAIVSRFAGIMLVMIILGCSNEADPGFQIKVKQYPESFTFFDVGINSMVNGALKENLRSQLGDSSVQGQNVITLEINYPGFIKNYFPDIDQLNRELNTPIGERVEHKTTKLMFRYSKLKKLPFTYVEFLFSDYSKMPLLIQIHFGEEYQMILDALKQKYGDPQVIDWSTDIGWSTETGKSLYWQDNQDLLLLSHVPDQFGNPTYQIVIYYRARLEELVEAEKREKEANAINPGKKAF